MTMRRRAGDDGATLVLVLILVTVLAVVLGAIMSLVDTNVRTTVALADQATEDYGIDGAAQVAIGQLTAGNFPGTNCRSASAQSAPFNGWIPSSSSTAGASVRVACSPNPDTGSGGGGNTSPGSAILTLSTGTGGERGIYVDSSSNASVKVDGGIFSNSTILLEGNKSDLENTNADSYIYAMGACGSSGSSKIISAKPPVCNYSSDPNSALDRRGKDPGTIPTAGASFNPPAAPAVVNPAPSPATCAAAGHSPTVYAFQPGLYTSAAALNALTDSSGNCSGSVWYFQPGTYFFNFTDAALAHRWQVSSGYLVGGAANVSGAVTVKKIQDLESAGSPFCKVPTVGGTLMNAGVEFVFGGDSRMYVKKGNASANPDVQICASNSASGPPIAIYGLKQSVGSGANAVPAQSGCITNLGYLIEGGDVVSSGDPTRCAVLQTTNDPNPALTVYGTTYVPKAVIDLYLNNNTVQVFRWGLVARSVLVGATGSPNLANAVISVPDDAPAPFATPSVVYLSVYVCPGASSCASGGTVRLRAKVQLSVATPTTASVLSWSKQN